MIADVDPSLGSKFLKTYILGFSIMANRSG